MTTIDEGADHQQHALHHRDVPGLRGFEQQLAEPGQREHRLGRHRARQHEREVVAEDDQRRARRVAQRVPEQDAPVGQAADPRADDVVLLEHLDQRGPQLPGDVRGDRQG